MNVHGADDIEWLALQGRDREIARAILSQSRLRNASRIDDIQVVHLLRIGYQAGRAVTDHDNAFDQVDAKLGGRAMFCYGMALGALVAGLLVWILG